MLINYAQNFEFRIVGHDAIIVFNASVLYSGKDMRL